MVLTGARKSEIMTLEWSWINDRRAALPDSKTGPKTLYLCAAVEDILARHKRKHRRFIFPAKTNKKAIACIDPAWWSIRKAAGLEDVRLHDLRDSYVSFALKSGYGHRIIGRLLGHNALETTFKYLHTDDDMMRQSLEKLMPILTDIGRCVMLNQLYLTDRSVQSLKSTKKERYIWDTKLAGFALRQRPSVKSRRGANSARGKSWVIYLRRDGKTTKTILGKPPQMNAETARIRARAFLLTADFSEPAKKQSLKFRPLLNLSPITGKRI